MEQEQSIRLSFGDIVDEHDRLGQINPKVKALSLGDFSKMMKTRDPKRRDFSLGENPNIVKHISSNIDRAFKATGLPGLAGDLTGAAATMVGVDEDFGRSVGEGLPRGALEVLSQAGWLVPGPGWAVAAVGAASAGAQGYTATDSVVDGAIDAASTIATPFVGMFGRSIGASIGAARVGGQVVKGTRVLGKSTIGTRLGQAAIEKGSEEVAQMGLDAVTQMAHGNNPLSAEMLFANLITSTVDVVSSGPAVKRLIDGKVSVDQPFSTGSERKQAQNITKVLDEQRAKYDEGVVQDIPTGKEYDEFFQDAAAEEMAARAAEAGEVVTPTAPKQLTPNNVSVDRKIRKRRILREVQITADRISRMKPTTVADTVSTNAALNKLVLTLNKDFGGIFKEGDADVRSRLHLNDEGLLTAEGLGDFVAKMQKIHDEPIEKSLARVVDHMSDVAALVSKRTAEKAAESKPKVVNRVEKTAAARNAEIQRDADEANAVTEQTGAPKSIDFEDLENYKHTVVETANQDVDKLVAEARERGLVVYATNEMDGGLFRLDKDSDQANQAGDELIFIEPSIDVTEVKADKFAHLDLEGLQKLKLELEQKSIETQREATKQRKEQAPITADSMAARRAVTEVEEAIIASNNGETKAKKGTTEHTTTDTAQLEVFNSAVQRLDETEMAILAEAYGKIGKQSVAGQAGQRMVVAGAETEATSVFQHRVIKYVEGGKKGDLKASLGKALTGSSASALTKKRRRGEVAEEGIDINPNDGKVDKTNKTKESKAEKVEQEQRAEFFEEGREEGADPEITLEDFQTNYDFNRARYGVSAAVAYKDGFNKARAEAKAKPVVETVLTPKQASINDWNEHAAKAFSGLGIDEAVQKNYMALGQRVLTSFKDADIPRLVNLRQRKETVEQLGKVLGLHIPKNSKYAGTGTGSSRLIGLLSDKITSIPALDAFLRVGILAHESFHAAVGKLTKYKGKNKDVLERQQALKRMEERAVTMNPAERHEALSFFSKLLIPEKFRNDAEYDGILRQAAETPEEYLATFSELFTMSLASNKDAVFKVEDSKMMLSPEEVTFLQGQFKDLAFVTKALTEFSKSGDSKQSVNLGDFVKDFETLSRTGKQLRDAQKKMLKLVTYLDPESNVGRLGDAKQIEFEVEQMLNDPGIKAKMSPTDRKGIKEAIKTITEKSPFDKYDRSEGIVPSLWTKIAGNPMQWAKSVEDSIPIAREIVANMYDKSARVEAVLTKTNSIFLARNLNGRETSIERMKDKHLTMKQRMLKTAMGVVANNPKAERAFNDIALKHNTDRVDYSALADLQDVPSLAALDPETQGQVFALAQAVKHTNRQSAQQIIRFSSRQTSTMLGMYLMKADPELKSAAAREMGNALQKQAADAVATLDPKTQAMLHGQVMMFRRNGVEQMINIPQSIAEQKALRAELKADPSVDSRTIKTFTGSNFLDNDVLKAYHEGAVRKLGATLRMNGVETSVSDTVAKMHASNVVLGKVLDRPYFFSERRVGDWVIKYQRNGESELSTVSAPSRREANAIIRELEQDDGVETTTIDSKRKSREESASANDYMNPEALRIFVELEGEAYRASLERFGKDVADQQYPDYKPGEATLTKVLQERTRGFLRTQKQKPGRAYTNLWRSAIDYSSSVAHSLANAETRQNAELMMREPELKQHPEVVKMLSKWIKNETESTHTEYPGLRSGIFTYFLGYNISSAMLESSQSFLTVLPQLTSMTGSVREGGAVLGRASKTLAAAYNAKGWAKAGRLVFKDAELGADFQRAIDEKLLDYGGMEDVITTQADLDIINARRMGQGLLPMSLEEAMKNTANLYVKGARAVYGVTSGTNAKVAFIGGHEVGQKRGLKGEELYAFSKEFVRVTNFSGGQANRPFGMSSLGRAQGAGAVAMSLSNFMLSSLNMMGRLYKDALREAKAQGTFKNLSEAGGARKAFMQMMGTQAFFAGAMGMPLAGFMMKTLENMFGVEIYASIREGITKMAGDDEELGGMVSDIAMNGVPSAMLGVDVGSRFSLGSLFGLSAYDGFDIGGFAGAGGSIVKNTYDGLSQVAQGELGKGFQTMVPQAFKSGIELVRNDGDFRDQKGELMYEPGFGDKLAYTIGLKPKQLSDMKLQQRLMRNADKIATKDRRQALGLMAERLLQDDPQASHAMIVEHAKNSPYTVEELERAVVDIALERIIPKDGLDSGSKASAAERERIANTFGNDRPRYKEVDKLTQKKALRQKLTGVPDKFNPAELIRANALDQYLEQHPNTPRSAARAIVQSQLSALGL